MNTKEDNMLVKFVKKAVGLPVGGSSCSCATPVAKTDDCCTAEASEEAPGDCGCSTSPFSGDAQPPAQA